MIRPASATQRERKEAPEQPVVYYSINHKKSSMGFSDTSDVGQLLMLFDSGSRTRTELDQDLQASLDFMAESGKGAPYPLEFKEGYEQHKHLKESLPEILENLCKEGVLVSRDVRKSKPDV